MAEEQPQNDYDRRNRTYQDLIQQKDPSLQSELSPQQEEKRQPKVQQEQQVTKVTEEEAARPSLLKRVGKGAQGVLKKGFQAVTATRIQQKQVQDVNPKVQKQAEAAGYIEVLEGIAEKTGQQAELAMLQQMQQQSQQTVQDSESNQQIQQAQQAAQQAAQEQAQLQQQQQLKKVQEQRRKKQQEQAKKLSVPKPQTGLLKSLAKSQAKPVSTTKVLNAGVPGLGLFYKLFSKIVP